MGIILILSLAIALAAARSPGSAQTALTDVSLQVTALNDRPGPVEVAVRGADADGNTTITSTLTWDGDDNTFSTLETTIPTTTRTLRFTFVNDLYQGSGDLDLDRNAFIDYFEVDGVHYEAEDFDRTGGRGTASPGCRVGTAVIGTAGRIVANCGNQGDWVEYDLERVVLLPLVLRNSFVLVDGDGDGLSDTEEEQVYRTNPNRWDSDGDGLGDGAEVTAGTDPRRQDTDYDGLSDGQESVVGSDPFLRDTDGDGISDDDEIDAGLNPLRVDTDGDGITDSDELAAGTKPTETDSDNDDLSDGQEPVIGTDPLNPDTDYDGLDDGQEFDHGCDPLDPDTDHDDLSDADEVSLGTNPSYRDSDHDSIPDGTEVTANTDPLSGDSDRDGLPDAQEVVDGWNGFVLAEDEIRDIDFSAVFRAYVQMRAFTPGEAAEIQFAGAHCQVLLDDTPYWFGCGSQDTGGPLQVVVSRTEDVSVMNIVAVAVSDGGPYPRPTLANDPDTDGDDLPDGDETVQDTVWIEAEDVYNPMQAQVVTDTNASNSVQVEVPACTLPPCAATVILTRTQVVLPPGPYYGLYLRAAGDGKRYLQINLYPVAGGPPQSCSVQPRDMPNWLACGSGIQMPSGGRGLQIEVSTTEETISLGAVSIDRLVMLPLVQPLGDAFGLPAPLGEQSFVGLPLTQTLQISTVASLPYGVTDPLDPDTDRDGVRIDNPAWPVPGGALTDGNEVNLFLTNPFSIDTDDDADVYTENPIFRVGSDGIYDRMLGLPEGPDRLDSTDSNPRSNDEDHDGLRFGYDPNDCDPDVDNDGLMDGAEDRGGPQGPDGDLDNNDQIDSGEHWTETSLTNWDSDGDGIPDGVELGLFVPQNDHPEQCPLDDTLRGWCLAFTYPYTFPICSGPAFASGYRDHQTNPLSADTDGDGLKDGLEDVDKDGRYDPADGDTDPSLADTDEDGLLDGVEDANHNGLWEPDEPWSETDPRKPDTDGDGLTDKEEGENEDYDLDPLDSDCDNDGLLDGEEVGPGEDGVRTDPTDAHSDDDGVSDGDEFGVSDPTDPDSDDDGLSDAEELAIGTDPRDPDTDDDRLSDLHEVRQHGEPAPSEHCQSPQVAWPIGLSMRGDPLLADTDGDGFKDGDEVCCRTYPDSSDSHPEVDLRVISGTVTTDPAIALRGSPISLGGTVENRMCLTVSPLVVSASGDISGSGSISETITRFIGPFETRRWQVPLGNANEDMELTFSVAAERVLNDPDIQFTEPVTSDNAVTVTVPVYEPFTNLAITVTNVYGVSLFGATLEVEIKNLGGTHHDGQTWISSSVYISGTEHQIGGVPRHLIEPPIGELEPLGDAVVRTVSVGWSVTETTDVKVVLTLTACQEPPPSASCTPQEEVSLDDNTVTEFFNLKSARGLPDQAGVSIIDVHAEEQDSPWWPTYKAGAGNEARVLVEVANDGLHAGFANLRVEMQGEDGEHHVLEDGEVLVHYVRRQIFRVPFTGTVTLPRGTLVTFTTTLSTLSGTVLTTATIEQPLYHVDAYVRADHINFHPFDPPGKDDPTTLVVPLGNLGNVRSKADIPVHLYFKREAPPECGTSPDAQTTVEVLSDPRGGMASFDLVPEEKGTFSAAVQVCDEWSDNNTAHFEYTVVTSRQLFGSLRRGESKWHVWHVPSTPARRGEEDPFTVFIYSNSRFGIV
jgi:hypothetical protein